MRDEGLYLDDIVDAIGAILRFLDGISREEFLASDLLQSAVSQKFMIIGEAVSKISNDLRNNYPMVDWTRMKAFRNVIVHDYSGVDMEIVWATATNLLHPLGEQIQLIIAKDFPFEPTADK